MSQTIQCTHCNAILKLKMPLAAGKKVVCPKCKQSFETPADGPLTKFDTTTAVDMPPKDAAAKKAIRAVPLRPSVAESDDDDPDDDVPLSKKKRRADTDDDEDVPPIKTKKKSSGALLWILLLGGGFVAFIGCIGCGVGGYFVYDYMSGPKVRGTWEVTNLPGTKMTIEFRSDGTGHLDGPFANVQFKYTLNKEEPPVLEWEITRVDQKKPPPFGMGLNVVGVRERFRVTMQDDTMTLAPMQMFGLQMNLRRLK